MNLKPICRLNLSSRDEGKLKSHGSCSDVRAWSHDSSCRDHYLREWIKDDMPISVIPVRTLISSLLTMTVESKRRAIPRCYRDCKSKVLLESICSSCHVMRECFNEKRFDKYFLEEEVETSNWPCERCLEVLKSIKMFWKIIVEKILGVNLTELQPHCAPNQPTDSVRSVAKMWQTEILQQTNYVKNVTPRYSKLSNLLLKNNSNRKLTRTTSARSMHSFQKCNGNVRVIKYKNAVFRSMDSEITCKKRVNKYTSTHRNIDKFDVGCNTCADEGDMMPKQLQSLQERLFQQDREIEKLKSKNRSLKLELENVYKICPWNAALFAINRPAVYDVDANDLPLPYDGEGSPQEADSEMIITLAKCKNESYRDVSLLQVLHKSVEPNLRDLEVASTLSRKEDPVKLLCKVHKTFGKMVRREMNIVKNDKNKSSKSHIAATFSVIDAKSKTSYSTSISSAIDLLSIEGSD